MTETEQDLTPPEPSKSPSHILQLFVNHPVVGLISFLVALVSVIASFYFGCSAVKSRELSLYVNPARTTIVRSGQSSDLRVLYKGQPVSTDVTAIQIGIWNAGKESIRLEHILEPIVLTTIPRVAILEAKVRYVSRSSLKFSIDLAHISEGALPVSWKILEHDDGAVIQLIVAGSVSETIRALGSLEGQRGISEVSQATESSGTKLILILVVPLAVTILASYIVRIFKPQSAITIFNIVCILALALLLAIMWHRPVPCPLPFDSTMARSIDPAGE